MIYIFIVVSGCLGGLPTPPSPEEGGAGLCMTDAAEGVSPVRAFLAPLGLAQYRDVLKSLGYDDPESANYTPIPHLGTSP